MAGWKREVDGSVEDSADRIHHTDPMSPSSRLDRQLSRSHVSTDYSVDLILTTDCTDDLLRNAAIDVADIGPKSRLVMASDKRSPNADRMRFLRMHLRSFWNAGKLRTLVITSAHPKDGKSTVALNLATALAENGKRRVLLVDADFHQPSLAKTMQIESRVGLGECLEDGIDLFSVIRRVEPLQIYFLQSGVMRANPTDLVQSDSFASAVEKLKPHFDWIVFDTPPVEVLTDALVLSRIVDAVLLVVRAGQTPKKAVESAIERIGRRRIVGVLLNAAEGLSNLYSKYGQYYGRRS